ncbi:hypothetical protein PRIPAC_84432 [Pristionchus pacificus]|uniref:Uncharacterized protein n=1 Tax=Pristionchus pacificus TaxID=54126 RepID=A0A2A6BLF0_PRIPA|nr:hypothetical protein PRIPAC_84432 [Pristionchus pacificus]|eukprot:PDM66735.1 hypothetical protein PRIPAC_48152 [Pristionchus pacificus]
MSVRKWNDDDVEYLIAYLDCNDDGVYDIWRVENKSKLVLVNRKDSAMNKYYEMHCLNTITTVEAVKAIEKTKEFNKYSGSLNNLLLRKIIALSSNARNIS